MTTNDVFQARKSFELNGKRYNYYQLDALEKAGVGNSFKITLFHQSIIRICTSSTRWTSYYKRTC